MLRMMVSKINQEYFLGEGEGWAGSLGLVDTNYYILDE